MRRPTIAKIAAISLAVATAPDLNAQQPLGLLHGFSSSPATWATTASQLEANLSVQTTAPLLDWTAHFADQSSSIAGMFGSNVILVGHSNGGIVARMRCGDQALAGVLTWASPNAGVPLVNNFPWLVGYAGVTVSDATNVIIALSAYYLGADALNALDDPIDWVIQNVFNAVGGVADYLGYWYAPVLNDMAAGSSFQGVLNSGSHISEEQSNVGTIVSASFTPDYWYYGGMMTLLSYSNAIVTTDFVYGLAAGCYQWAFDLDNNADPNMDDDQWFALLDAEDALNWLGDDLAGFDAAWCSAVTGYNVTGPGDCPANDEVVPQWSSDLSWTVARHFPGTGNVHNRVAGDYLDLQNVLQNNFGVP